jgi:hydroxyethylthiazole kinase
MFEKISPVLAKLRQTKPLVLNLTNVVTMDFTANVLLALGVAPLMTLCNDELEELISIADSVCINIGTLEPAFIERCHLAIGLAKAKQKPIILDPVGAGASGIRTQVAQQYAKHASIIKGNSSEIIALKDMASKSQGVEAIHTTEQAKQIAIELALQYQTTIAVSGACDFITNGVQNIEVPYGSSLMPRVTGMGCALSTVIAAFHAVCADAFLSSALAMIYYGLCGQAAHHQSSGPGTFRTNFIDVLYAADFSLLSPIYYQQEAVEK